MVNLISSELSTIIGPVLSPVSLKPSRFIYGSVHKKSPHCRVNAMIKPNKLGGHAHVAFWQTMKSSIMQQGSYPINESWLNTPLITNSAGKLIYYFILYISQKPSKSKVNFLMTQSMPEATLSISLSIDCSWLARNILNSLSNFT